MANRFPKDLARKLFLELRRREVTGLDQNILINLFETLYFASLETEELQPITCYIVYLAPNNPDPNRPPAPRNDYWGFVRLASPIQFEVSSLVKLAKASDPRTSSFAVYPDARGQLFVWGLIDQGNRHHDYINYDADSTYQRPGVFQASILGIGHLTAHIGLEKIADLEGGTILGKTLDVLAHGRIRAAFEPSIQLYREAVRRLLIARDSLPEDASDVFHYRWDEFLANDWISTLCRLLLRVQNLGHGGAILITPDISPKTLNVKYSIQYPRLCSALEERAAANIESNVAYEIIDDEYLDKDADEMPIWLYLDEAVSNASLIDCNSEIDGTIWFISLLTRVDGLVLMNPRLEVQGFGAVIADAEVDLSAFVIADNEDATQVHPFPFNHYGTRHQSMMRYCAQVPNSVGFVISQDGDVRAITQIDGRVVMWTDIRLQRTIETRRRRRSKRSSSVSRSATGTTSVSRSATGTTIDST